MRNLTPRTKRALIYAGVFLLLAILHSWRVVRVEDLAFNAGVDDAMLNLANVAYENEQAGNPKSLRELTAMVREELKK